MVVWFTSTYTISAYNSFNCECDFLPVVRLIYTILYAMKSLSDFFKLHFSGFLVFSTNTTDRHNITEILLKMEFSTPTTIFLVVRFNGYTRHAKMVTIVTKLKHIEFTIEIIFFDLS